MTDPAPPRTLLADRYEILQQLARGGMADVFLARDQVLHRLVAVKVMFTRYANDPTFVARFQREAKSAARLNHPNVVAVYDSGVHQDTYFIVMEYVEGQTLAQKLASEGPLSIDDANEIASEVADALSVAHAQGMVHRDIKPSNILLTREGQAKVTDFGIARAVEGDADLTAAGSVMGTASYLSPEQAQGNPVDPRSDLYSLGVVLFEMVTGRTPFPGASDVAVAYKHVQEAAPLARSVQPSIPPAMEAIIDTLLAKNPADRYATAADLRSDLDRLWNAKPLQGATPVQAQDVGPTVAMAVPQPVQQPVAQVPVGQVSRGIPATEVLPASRHAGGGQRLDSGPSSSGSGWFVAAVAALIVILIGLIIFIANGIPGGNDDAAGELVIVPTVVGDSQATATNRLAEVGLVPLVKFEPNENEEADIVFAQDPAPRTEVEMGSTVTITVASTEETVVVPNVVDRRIEDARTELTNLGFIVKTEEEPSETVEAGRVISQSIEPNQEANSGAEITLIVSTGQDVQQIPSVVNLTQAAAEEQLRALGFIPQIAFTDVDAASGSAGLVVSQSPQPGQEGAAGTIVTLQIGRNATTTTTSTTTTRPPSTTQTTTTTTTKPPTSSTTTTTTSTSTTDTTSP